MHGLILETSCDQAYALLTHQEHLVATVPLGTGPELSKNLGLLIQDFVAGITVHFIAIGTGPGSYTGIRVGAAMAQALAFGWKVPLLPFPSLIKFTPQEKPTPPFAIVLASGSCFQENRPIPLTDLHNTLIFSPHPEQVQKKLGVLPLQATVNLPFLAAYCWNLYTQRNPDQDCTLTPLPLSYHFPLEKKI